MSEHGYPDRQGLYDPQQEHDACGFGFVVRHPGARLARHRAQGAHGAREPGAPRRRRRREELGRRRGHPLQTPARLPGRSAARAGVKLPRPGALRRRAWSTCRRRRRAGAPARDHRASGRRGGAARCSAGATFRRTTEAWARARGQPAGDPAGVRRPRRGLPRRSRLRAEALRHPAAGGEGGLALRPPAARAVLRPVAVAPDHRLQGDAERRPARRVLPRPRRPGVRVRHRDGALALLDQHVPAAGRARTRTATSRTTARSTRCAATSTGCTRGSR